MYYKDRFSFLTLVCLLFCLGAANSTVTTDSINSTQITLQYVLQNQDYQISTVKINKKDYTFITLKDASRERNKGEPDLPQVAQAVIIPDKGVMQLKIIDSQFTEQKVNAIVASKGPLSRKFNPADVPCVFGPVYSKNSWFPKLCAHLGRPYIAGDYRGSVVYFQPFQYNPSNNTLRIYSKITVSISYTSEPGINEKSRSGGLLITPSFDQIYSHSFVNYPKIHHQVITEEGSMLVISHKDFMPAAEPLVDWKNKRGVKTELVDIATIGTSADSIQTYIANYYKDKSKNLKYLLLVGDADKIPSLKNIDWIDSDAKNGTSDNMYGMIEGDDAYMEIFVGRLSGNSATDIQNQVDKILYYERKFSVNDTWLGNAVVTADTTERDDLTAINYIISDLSGYIYKSINKYTVATVDNPKMVSDVNKGIGVHFNASHGDVGYTVALVNDDVIKMTNVNKYPFNFTSACLPGKFDTTTECLAEVLLRKEKGGFAGAFMATINQTWDEPYAAIKEQADILCEKYPSNIKRTYGGIAINGCFKMLDQYPTEGPEQLRCWELFGDPNMHVYTSTPIAMTINHPANVDTGIQNITISGTDKATICLYSKKLGIQKALDLSSGKAVFSIPVSGKDGDTIYVTGTMYNHVTYEGFMVIQTGTTHVSIDYAAPIKTFAASITDSHLNYQIPDNIGENRDMAVIVKLFTPQGKLVSIFTDGNKGPGKYSVVLTKDGRLLAKGTYLSSIKAGNFKKVMKVVLK